MATPTGLEWMGGLPKHVGRALTEEHRQHWMQLLLRCADYAGLPDDPEFRSTFVAYLNSQTGAGVSGDAPMPAWGWGETGGPYIRS